MVPIKTDFLQQQKPKDRSQRGIVRNWNVVPGVGYQLRIDDMGIQFDLSRVRTRFNETHGLLLVSATFRGARTIGDNILTAADFNVSTLRSRQDRARYCAERANAPEIDWAGLIDDLCLRVLEHEERGHPEVAMEDIPCDIERAAEIEAGTLPLLRNHPTIWFGDGAAGKSLMALFAAIDMAQQGYNVLYCDWELDGESHAQRLKRFIGPVPGLRDSLFYRRCERSFQNEAFQIRDVIAKRKINFLICDSIGFAAEGAPESAEAATGYFRALRECGPLGSLHLAHMNRSEQGNQKPFGSVFWHAGARATWFMKRTSADDTNRMAIGFYNRKSNFGRLRPAFGREIMFHERETNVNICDIANEEEMAVDLPLRERIAAALRDGPQTLIALADELGAKKDSIRRIAARDKGKFSQTTGSDGIQRLRLVE